MKQFLFIISFWIFISFGCDPCHDCEQPLHYDPYVKMVFINQDSAIKVQMVVTHNSDSIKANDSIKKAHLVEIDIINDSLVTVDSLINAGNSEYLANKTSLTNHSDSLLVMNDSLTSWSTQITRQNSNWNKVLSRINSGYVLIQSKILENGADVLFTDSLKSFRMPLLLGNDEHSTTSYLIFLDKDTFEIAFSYSMYETFDELHRVFNGAKSLDTLYQTFDSLTVNCRTSECISDEATLTAYF